MIAQEPISFLMVLGLVVGCTFAEMLFEILTPLGETWRGIRATSLIPQPVGHLMPHGGAQCCFISIHIRCQAFCRTAWLKALSDNAPARSLRFRFWRAWVAEGGRASDVRQSSPLGFISSVQPPGFKQVASSATAPSNTSKPAPLPAGLILHHELEHEMHAQNDFT